jgi:hypothetical protein
MLAAGGCNLKRLVVSQRGTGPVNVRSIRITGAHPDSFRVLCFSAVPELDFPLM